MGPTGVPLMGELRKNHFTRHLKSCWNVIRRIRAKVNSLHETLVDYYKEVLQSLRIGLVFC
ncbi:putative NAD(P)/FAD-binding protein YdhS [Paraburkholderia youngii]|uniref:Putative NAD(P)/FAD-binding protein YdhS n=1 Tax=Paraburkholderia youngii TaxID=2782701 RepID=A0A7W8LE93_9BURK|nr:putative NAD(P)/FAD-binding protein YdhS [Paraburkholderia youngii]